VKPQIGVFHWQSLPENLFEEFITIVKTPNLHLQTESREDDGPYAGIEWLLPTAAIVYVGKSYFDGFLKEMGKEHYVLLKMGINALYKRFFTSGSPKIVTISTKGKLPEGKYSRTFSIYADGEDGSQFKLLLEQDLTEEEYKERVSLFLNLIWDFHKGCREQAPDRFPKSSRFSKTCLLAYNAETKDLEVVDPLPKRPTIKEQTVGRW
jgi:hypothetical protein